jgi:hypothetical protein
MQMEAKRNRARNQKNIENDEQYKPKEKVEYDQVVDNQVQV